MADDSIYKALNSISWQLKRIADVLERTNQTDTQHTPKESNHLSKLRELINQD